MKFGYARVSSQDQNESRQVEVLSGLVDTLIIEKVSGKNLADRPELQNILTNAREDDELICKSIDRLARNTKELLEIVEDLTKRGVKVTFLDNSMTFDNTPTSKFIITLMAAVGELERGMIHQRQREGIAIAKEKGIYKGKPKNLETREKVIKYLNMEAHSTEEIARLAGCGVATVYRIKKELTVTN